MSLVLVEREPPIAVVRLNRPEARNALSDALMDELVARLSELDADDEVRCIVLAGDERAFAAGADIAELAAATAVELYQAPRVARWDAIRKLSTPLVAAVSGWCLGGGCELAMTCDLIVASDTARFGQPETGLGIIPGAGGTQRLARAVGKALAMDMVLTGRVLSAEEARSAGLVARVVAKEAWLDEARRVASEIAARAPGGAAARAGVRRPGIRDRSRLGARLRAQGALPGVRLRGCPRGPERVRREEEARVEVEVARDGAVLTITLNRPDKLNAFDDAMHAGFRDALKAARDAQVRAVVLTGAGRGFCVGQDLASFAGGRDVGALLRDTYHPNIRALGRSRSP